MNNLEIRKIPGVGRMTELILNDLSIRKCSDLVEKQADIWVAFKEGTA